MKVSIVTATWNSAKTIEATIASLSEQTYQNIEYIVIDGGSRDATVSILQSNFELIDYFVSESDSGIYDALNKGIAAATGEVVGFLHSDDFFTDNSVVETIAKTFSNPNIDCIFGDLNYISKNDTNKIVRKWRSGVFDRERIRNGWMPPHPTFYMRRSLYNKYGGFDLNYRISADYDSILRFLWTHKISAAYIPKVLVSMRVGGESNRSLRNIVSKSGEDIQAMKKNGLPFFRAMLGKNLGKIPQFFFK
ncbi:glycosyltransferase [Paraglaciecola agarilytica]|uniref:glycosyltransferase family 2 protein n=1 Tax=Paraglaciecola chathamensis TaxID=368405 RepID=UPI001C09AC32|nr:glycosyltransferase family 2 protein [Paraglaciecola agarilytica]MBU3016146.1 glycosyltransferase [Paraglaciecola agarilytica]